MAGPRIERTDFVDNYDANKDGITDAEERRLAGQLFDGVDVASVDDRPGPSDDVPDGIAGAEDIRALAAVKADPKAVVELTTPFAGAVVRSGSHATGRGDLGYAREAFELVDTPIQLDNGVMIELGDAEQRRNAVYNLAIVARMEGRWSDAAGLLHRVVTEDPDDEFSRALMHEARATVALEDLSNNPLAYGVTIHPDDTTWVHCPGLGRLNDAIEEYGTILAIVGDGDFGGMDAATVRQTMAGLLDNHRKLVDHIASTVATPGGGVVAWAEAAHRAAERRVQLLSAEGYHVVAAGQSIYTISRHYFAMPRRIARKQSDSLIESFQRANEGTVPSLGRNPHLIYPEQRIRLPPASEVIDVFRDDQEGYPKYQRDPHGSTSIRDRN